MRKLLLLCLLITGIQATAQQYIPFPTSNAAWRYRQTGYYNGLTPGTLDILYMIDGADTIIKGYTYKKIQIRTHFWAGTNWTPPTVSSSNITADSADKYYAAVRESNKKVYVMRSTDTAEQMYYDYDLHIGDSLNCPTCEGRIVVTDVDSVQTGTRFHKRYNDSNKYFHTVLIEGIGPLWFDLLKPGNGQTFTRLICFTDSFGTYVNDTFTCNYIFPYGTPTAVNTISKEQPAVFPNPCTNELNIKEASGSKAMVYNAMGIKIYEAVIDSKPIQTSHWANGIYFLVLKDEKGNVSGVQKIIKE